VVSVWSGDKLFVERMALYSCPREHETKPEYAPSIALEILSILIRKKTRRRWLLGDPLKTMWDGEPVPHNLHQVIFHAWKGNETQIYADTNVKTKLDIRGLYCQFIGSDAGHAHPTVLFAHSNDRVREAGHDWLLKILQVFKHVSSCHIPHSPGIDNQFSSLVTTATLDSLPCQFYETLEGLKMSLTARVILRARY
jgi:hypothetical protein